MLLVVREHRGLLYIEGRGGSYELTPDRFSSMASSGGYVFGDLGALGLRLINDFMLHDVSRVRITSYNLSIHMISYRGLVFKNSALFGIDGAGLSCDRIAQTSDFI